MGKKNYLFYLRIVLTVIGVVCLITALVMLAYYIEDDNENKTPENPSIVEHKVMFLSSYNPLYFTFYEQEKGLKEVLYGEGIEYDVFFMDTKRYNSDEDILAFYEYFKTKVIEDDPEYEAVLIGDDDALNFAIKYQDELFSGLPLVFFGINDLQFAQNSALNPMITGFYEKDYLQETLQIAKSTMPERKHYVALHDMSAAGKADVKIFYSFQDRYQDIKFTDIDTSKFTEDELVEELHNLPEDSILFYMTCYNDADNKTYSMLNRTTMIVSNTSVPIMRNYPGGRDMGVLGGTYMDFSAQTHAAAQIVVELLKEGKDISDYGLFIDTPSKTEFNYPLMQKYGINERKLPLETEYVNRPVGFYDMYKDLLSVACLMMLSMVLFMSVVYIAFRNEKSNYEKLVESKNAIEESRKQLKYQAEHDYFLDLLNRRSMVDFFNTNLTAEQTYSVFMLDLDGFKSINESYGHEVGDEILMTIAEALRNFADEHDLIIGRYGGDEFLFLNTKGHMDANSEIIKDIKCLFNKPFFTDNVNIVLSVSIGISNSDRVIEPSQNIINAEIAMYEAKERGRNMVFVYADEMKDKVNEEANILAHLSRAFEEDGFYMQYQPKVRTKTKEVVGYEALVRLKDNSYPPGVFIPIIEKSGWVTKLGRLITSLVIEQLHEWTEQGKELKPVSINYSSMQINDIGYSKFLMDMLKKYDVEPKYIEIEITESLLLNHSDQTDNLFKQFKENNIKLLLDDFGTGYSSLAYLIYMPVDVIKLAKSIVDAYLVEGKDDFIRDVIQLVHDIHKDITIEGVEDEHQYERLKELNADTIQGFYFSSPLDAELAIDFKVE